MPGAAREAVMPRGHPIMPFVATAAGIATFCLMDVAMKRAAIANGVYSAQILRGICGTSLMLPVWLAGGGGLPSSAALRVHLLRSAVVAGMATLYFFGLVRIPLAEAIALSFIAPLIALYLAAVLLGEQIRPSAIVASLLGFAGMLVIAGGRIGSGHADARLLQGIAAILASAVLYAWNLVLQRQQAQLANPREIAFFQNMFVTVALAPAAPWFLHWPPTPVLFDIVAAAVLAAVSLMMLSWAYARAETQALVPIEYTGFIWAALFGWLWFAETVTPATLVGVVLIVAGCWIAGRQRTEQTAL